MNNNPLSAFSNTPQPSMNLPHTPVPSMQSQAAAPNIDNQLNALADIHLPEQISWWPPAPGWWIVFVITILIIYFIYKIIKKQLHRAKFRKQAREELHKITRFWQKQQNLIATASHLSSLIRRIALAENNKHKSRSNIASLSDHEWLLYLQQQPGLKNINQQYDDILLQLPYQDPMIHFDVSEKKQLATKMDSLLLSISTWIKKGFKHV